MKRNHIVVGAALAVSALFPASALADEGSVVGGGVVGAGFAANSLAINTSGDGASVTGSVQFVDLSTLQTINGTVVCINVEGNRASVIYRDTPDNGGKGGVIRLEDGGFGLDSQRNGRLSNQQINQQIAAGCPLPVPFPTLNMMLGDIQITPAAPPI
jgi:hypothetical protein